MMTPDKKGRFPKTNKEYFRFVLVRGLVISGVAFLVAFIFGKVTAPSHRWRDEEFLRTAAICLLIGFNLTLVYMRWLKRQDEKGNR